MDEFFNSIGILNSDFSVEYEFVLRENLRQAEEKCCERVTEPDQAEVLKRKLWIHLVKLSLDLENLQLAELLVAKLELVQLALLVRSAHQQDNKVNKLIALRCIAKYFNIEYDLKPKVYVDISDSSNSPSKYDRLIDIYIDSDEWESAFNLNEEIPLNDEIKDIKRCLIAHKFATHLEVDEKFEQALVNYERSGGELENSARVIIKQYMNSAFKELKNYCLKNVKLQNFWNQYHLIALGIKFKNSDGIFKSTSNSFTVASSWGCGWLKGNLELTDSSDTTSFVFSIPNEIRNFVLDTGSNKWFKKRRVESIISSAASLNSNFRARLAELSRAYDQNNLFSKASGIYVCIDQIELFLTTSSKFLNKLDCLQLACQFKSNETILTNMVDYLFHGEGDNHQQGRGNKVKKRQGKGNKTMEEREVLAKSCVELGLIDEALQIFSFSGSNNDQIIVDAIKHIETLIELKHRGSLDHFDPSLSDVSLKLIRESLVENQVLATNVMTAVILCTTIFLYKLNNNSERQLNNSNLLFLTKLEIMFKNLSDYFDELTFNASESLISSTNALIIAIKDKLDFFSDSVIIKEGFRKIVETIASRCMIEGQYKKAAMLYRHIEDNINAVKSLMRIRDVEIVVNFSLLVRDITVNRLTINYLKHLNVDSKIIEDFIARSKAIE